MTVVDTSIIIDVLRGHPDARAFLRRLREAGPVHASQMTRLEVLAGMRSIEEQATRALLDLFVWHSLDEEIAELAGELGRRWLPAHGGIDSADLVIAATAMRLDMNLASRNVRHFPMFAGLQSPY